MSFGGDRYMDNTAEPRLEPSGYRFRRFNLLKILLVIVILGVLSVMLMPVLGPGPMPSKEACANNLWFDGCVTFLRGQDYEAAVKACSD